MNEIKNDCLDEQDYCDKYKKFKNQIEINNNKEFMEELIKAQIYIKNISTIFIDIKDDKLENIEKIMEYLDKYCKLGLFALFSVIIIFCLFLFLKLTLYFICNCGRFIY